ncbi:unnamed protein product [Microthlaspi erraticum]|uniref:Integrase catalytic domain-containing protein n=1 Tax=Microthlaspi erraticum TaxID=1685480 RepID=A0A6D2JUM8_9BRAS|nr:unnamed protein product [Microthlaspi erraticum]
MPSSSTPVSANVATHRGSNNNNNFRRQNHSNNNRGNQTWQQQQQFQPHQDNYPPRGYQGRCQICGVHGHSARRCSQINLSGGFLGTQPRPQQPTSAPWQPRANLASTPTYNANNWVMDSGATHHLTTDLSNLSLHQPYLGGEEVTIADGTNLHISHTGSSQLPTLSKPLTLTDVLYVPDLKKNLISVYRLCNANRVSVEFFPASFQVKDLSTGARLLQGKTKDELYEWPVTPKPIFSLAASPTPKTDLTNGISHLTSPPHTPEHNGISERKHRRIVETWLTLLSKSTMPKSYWPFAFSTGVYLINRLPTAVLGNESPYHKLFQQQPNYLKLRVFGCSCFPWLRPYTKHKLEDRSINCVFIGYSLTQSAYLCLDRATGRIYTSRHVTFDETTFPFSTTSNPIPTSLSDSPITHAPATIIPHRPPPLAPAHPQISPESSSSSSGSHLSSSSDAPP